MEFINTFNNQDSLDFTKLMHEKGQVVDCILTSPPYNTSRKFKTSRALEKRFGNRYDIHLDTLTDNEYIDWLLSYFEYFDKVLNKDGVILLNMSYSSDNYGTEDVAPNELMWRVVNDIIMRTDFTIADCIIWKKGKVMPNNTSHNRLTRIVEFVFVISRKSELLTFKSNKQVKTVSSRGQNFYHNMFNHIEAPNNDTKTDLNRATFSSDFAKQLIDMYVRDGGVVYDPFMGTGSTAIGVLKAGRDIKYIGAELSSDQVEYSKLRVKKFIKENEVIS